MRRTPLATLMSIALFGTHVAQASAGRCDGWVAKAEHTEGSDLVDAFQALRKCDAETARVELDRFVKAAKDITTLVSLAIEGIEANGYNALWSAMEQLAYEHRTALASGVGQACTTHPDTVTFLQGAYIALKGNDFSAWMPALEACADPKLDTWMASVVTDPPQSSYSDKYNAILTAYVNLHHAAALPALEKAAIAAADAGPFNNILQEMARAIQPSSMSGSISPQAQAALGDALVRIGLKVKPDTARQVADRLYTAGDESRAASLIPRIYPDKLQPDGGVMWAVAALEQCGGQGIVHWTTLAETPPTHWAISTLVQAPFQALSSKLGCPRPWSLHISDSPVIDAKAAKDWVKTLADQAAKGGDRIKVVEEKKVLDGI